MNYLNANSSMINFQKTLKRKIFESLKVSGISSYTEHLNCHNVIYIDFSRTPDICNSYEDYISSIRQNLYND